MNEQLAALASTDILADRIRIKNNALAFYSKHSLVCKCWLDSSVRGRSDLQAEALSIRKVREAALFSVPRLFQDNSNPDEYRVPAIWFEAIAGRTPSGEDVRDSAVELTKLLVSWYEYNSVEFVSPDELGRRGAISNGRLLDDGWLPAEAETILSAWAKVLRSGMSLPVSEIHGDASVGNTMRDRSGELVVIDWESSRKDLVACDMPKLIAQGGQEVRNIFETWLGAKQHNDMFPVDCQLSIVHILGNLELPKKVANLKRTLAANDVGAALSSLKTRVLREANALCRDL